MACLQGKAWKDNDNGIIRYICRAAVSGFNFGIQLVATYSYGTFESARPFEVSLNRIETLCIMFYLISVQLS